MWREDMDEEARKGERERYRKRDNMEEKRQKREGEGKKGTE